MTRDKLIAAVLLADFIALNVYALWQTGVDGLIAFMTEMDIWTMVLTADLVICLTLAAAWMYRDARRRGRSGVLPAASAALGCIGPLLYLIGRKPATDAEAPVVATPSAAAPARG